MPKTKKDRHEAANEQPSTTGMMSPTDYLPPQVLSAVEWARFEISHAADLPLDCIHISIVLKV